MIRPSSWFSQDRPLGTTYALVWALTLSVLLAAVASLQASAARSPSARERAEVTRALLIRIERDNPAVTVRVNRVLVSTKLPGKRSIYSQFAAADALGRDRSGRLVGSPIRALMGFSRRFQTWVAIDYGSDLVGCNEPQVFFGGRRAVILRDLGLGCP